MIVLFKDNKMILFKDVLRHRCINCGEWVVEQADVRVSVDRSGQVNSRLLASTQRDALLTDQGSISKGHQLEVSLQRAHLHHLLVPFIVELHAEQNVISYTVVE